MSERQVQSSRVKVLDPLVAQQVAAGEIVDRPASVVKELVENALDADASSIEIELKEGGRARMAVHDNGRGMVEEDARTAVLSHATSKIASVEDLHSVSTLGFRGEALPSIASVAAFELTTSTGEGAATRVSVDGGSEATVSAASRPRGTSVVVERLFYNVPARREFLKSKKVERATVNEVFTHLALAHPEVSFKLTDDHREQLSLPATRDMRERLAGIYGLSSARAFRRVEHESFPYKVEGYAALPSLTYTNRHSVQTVSVNGRWVRAASLTKAIDDAYRGMLPSGRYPPLALTIEVDERKVDVNVHPTKQVVRFSDEDGLRRAVTDGLNLAISEGTSSGSTSGQPVDSQSPGTQATTEARDPQAHTPQDSGETRQVEQGGARLPRGGEGHSSDKPREARAEESATLFHAPGKGERERNAHKIPGYQQQIRTASESLRAEARSKQPPRQEDSASEGRKLDLRGLGTQQTEPEPLERGELPAKEASRVIGQFDLGYILVEEPGALWVVDQHVAHERVLLDRLNAGESVYVQQLLTPEVVEFSETEAAEGRELIEELSVYGFEAEPFGPRSFRITGVISTLADRDVAEAFKDALSVARGTEGGQHREQGILATVACKSAVKLGDKLSHGELEALVEQWLTTDLPATCPHGRSICYRMDAREIGRKLDRH